MELRHLRYFVAVAEEGQITAAARRLRLAQPSLSAQIKDLEREVGTALLERTPRGVVPTAAGEVLLAGSRDLLLQLERTLQATRETAGTPPPLRIGLTAGVSAGLLDRLWAAARAQRPSVTLDLRDATMAEQLDLLARGQLDLGLLTLPVSAGELTLRPVWAQPLGVLLHTGNPLAGRTELGWADLRGQALLWFPREDAPDYHDQLLAACREHGWDPPLRVVASRHRSAMALLLGEPGTVALRPHGAAHGQPALTWRPLEPDPPQLRFGLAAARPALTAVLDGLARHLRSSPPQPAPASGPAPVDAASH